MADRDFTAKSFSENLCKSVPARILLRRFPIVQGGLFKWSLLTPNDDFPGSPAVERWLHAVARALGDFSGAFVLVAGHQSVSQREVAAGSATHFCKR